MNPTATKVKGYYPKGGEIMTTTYETVLILDPALQEEEIKGIENRITEIIQSENGKLELVDHWGKRKLAYSVKKRKEGYYLRFVYNALPVVINEIGRISRISEQIIKFITVKVPVIKTKEKKPKDQKAVEAPVEVTETKAESKGEENASGTE